MNRLSILRLDRILFIAGALLLAGAAVAKVHGELAAHRAIAMFAASQTPDRPTALPSDRSDETPRVDVTLWSAQRIRDYMESLVTPSDPPLAVLRIPKLHIEVPVFDGTDDFTLNRGAGRIIGTARLGEPGNVGIAAHRDGFFRGLKDIARGDTIEINLPHGVESYVVTNVEITTPEDVSVLRPTPEASLTLVTCYPFYFVGSAPQRFIVQASIRGTSSLETHSQKFN